MSAYSRPGRSNSREDSQTQADLARGDLLSCTFFYNPDPRDENGNPFNLKHSNDDKNIQLCMVTIE